MRPLAFYLAGGIKKGEKDKEKICWEEEDKDFIRNELEGWEIIFLDPQTGGEFLKEPKSSFGRDMTQVTNCDFVLVDGRQKRGLGVGAEMMLAKLRAIPVISIVPKNTHYHRDRLTYLGQEVTNFRHPFVFSLSDHVADDLAGAMEWIREHLKNPQPVKGMHSIEDAMRHYRETQLEGDKPMKEFLSKKQ